MESRGAAAVTSYPSLMRIIIIKIKKYIGDFYILAILTTSSTLTTYIMKSIF